MREFLKDILVFFLSNKLDPELYENLSQNNQNVIFDIGCYKGNFSKEIIEKMKDYRSSKFFLFDPNPNCQQYVDETLIEYKQIYKFYQIALDKNKDKKTFYLNNFFEPSGSSLSNIFHEDKLWVQSRRLFLKFILLKNKVKDFSEISVNTDTLDNFSQENDIKKIDLLKIDAEGSEMSILEGAKEILQKGVIKLVFVEITDTKSNFKLKKLQIKNFLGKYEFYLASSKKIKSVSFLSNLYAEDCLFILSQ